MKKLFLFTLLSALTFSLNSCSGDDDSAAPVNAQPGGTISFKFNGVQKTFNNVVIDQEVETEGDVWLTVTGSENGSSSNMISFNAYQGDLGSDKIMNLEYTQNDVTVFYTFQPNSNIQVNSNNTLSGTFSGFDSGSVNGNAITEGTFSAVY